MPCSRLPTAAVAVLAFCLLSRADPPKDPAPAPDVLPVGLWRVEFANGVVEACQVREDGRASVIEPLRTSGGKAEAQGGPVVIRFDDDRVERWTQVGRRMVVEHWSSSAQFPSGTPVLGIADRAP